MVSNIIFYSFPEKTQIEKVLEQKEWSNRTFANTILSKVLVKHTRRTNNVHVRRSHQSSVSPPEAKVEQYTSNINPALCYSFQQFSWKDQKKRAHSFLLKKTGHKYIVSFILKKAKHKNLLDFSPGSLYISVFIII